MRIQLSVVLFTLLLVSGCKQLEYRTDGWSDTGFSIEEMNWWKKNGFGFKEARLWDNSKFSPHGAKKWKTAGFISGSYIQGQARNPNNLPVAEDWVRTGITNPQEALKWMEAGFNADDAYNYKGQLDPLRFSYESDPNREYGITPEEAIKWKNSNFESSESLDWRYYDFTLAEAVKWREMDIDTVKAIEYRDKGFTPETAMSGISPAIQELINDIERYSKSGVAFNALKLAHQKTPRSAKLINGIAVFNDKLKKAGVSERLSFERINTRPLTLCVDAQLNKAKVSAASRTALIAASITGTKMIGTENTKFIITKAYLRCTEYTEVMGMKDFIDLAKKYDIDISN